MRGLPFDVALGMPESEVFQWMIALGEAQGFNWDWDEMAFDMEAPLDGGDESDEPQV